MSYFPVSLNLQNKHVLLIGGGSIAAFKLQKIKLYSPLSLTCVAKEFSEEYLRDIDSSDIIKKKAYEVSDLENMDIVIVAIDDKILQESIYQQCRDRKILCNCVDLLHCCDFIFPSIIKKGEISIAITSNGKVPGFSAVFKEYLEKCLPVELEKGFAEVLKLRQTLPAGPERMKIIRDKARQFFNEEFKGVKSEK